MSSKRSKVQGYLVLFRMVDVDIEHGQLKEYAEAVGFPERFLPNPPGRRNAWEKATNLGPKGIAIDAPDDLVAECLLKYGVAPRVRLRTEIIRRAAPKLVRHIVRTVTIPTPRNEEDKRKLAHVQFDPETVAIMEFDTEQESFVSTGRRLYDTGGWVNGNLYDTVEELHERVDKAVNRADGAAVRNGIRDFVNSYDSTLLSSGGAYFIPFEDGLADLLRSLKAYVELLGEYAVKRDEDGGPLERPSVRVVTLTDDGDAFDLKSDIAADAVEQYSKRLNSALEELAPVLAGERTETVSENIRKRVANEYADVTRAISKYRVLLNDSLSGLDGVMKKAQQMMDKANNVHTYRPLKNQRGLDAQDLESESLERDSRGLGEVEIEGESLERGERSL